MDAAGGADIVGEVTLLLRPGEIVGLVGESGCGKTTVGLAVLGHCRRGAHIASGEILVGGHGVHDGDERGLRSIRGRIASYIPQDPSSALNPALRIGRQLREVLDQLRKTMMGPSTKAVQSARRWLALGMAALALVLAVALQRVLPRGRRSQRFADLLGESADLGRKRQ